MGGEKTVEVSAAKGINLDQLLNMIGKEIPNKLVEKEFIVPYDRQKLISMLHEDASIINEKYTEKGAYIKALVNEEVYEKCADFEI